ncbi:MAG: flagellar hook protein FlgE [Proteobacteria bacterium]|nr:MAG: flagellar hook protein FlgE [Pseudomonadota bacterium]
MPFEIALTGMNAASADLSIIGNNIANSGTTGFKQSRGEFADIFAVSNLGTAGNAIGQGVQLSNVAQQFTQGNLSFTESPLDLAVSGEGFFRLNENGNTLYSRSGAFHADNQGYIVNNQNQRLTGFLADAAGNITGALGDMVISTANIAPSATATANLALNLDANATIIPAATLFTPADPATFNHSTSATIYDSLGNGLLATTYYRRTAANTWNSYLYVTPPGGTPIEIIPSGGVAGDPVVMGFNNAGVLTSVLPVGTVAGTSAAYTSTSLAAATGGANLNLELRYAGTSQYGSAFTVASLTQDGYPTGRLSSIDIEQDGTIFGRFTNGQSQVVGQVALSTFNNVQGLRQLGETSWAESFESGAALTGTAGTGTLGLIQSGALEESNVDLSQQLVKLITAQRNFQANAQVISTADQVTQTIINIR